MTSHSPIGTRKHQLINRSAGSSQSLKSNQSYRPVDGSVIIATDISFTAPATIASAGSGFGLINVGDNIEINGSASNNRVFMVETASAASITVSPALVTTESAGATVHLNRGVK